MVRAAHIEDIPRLIALGEEFFRESGLDKATEYNTESAGNTFAALITQESGALLVIEHEGMVVGGAGALIAPFFFNAAHKVGQEFFWFVSKEHRGSRDSFRLMKALEDAAREKGASFFYIAALATGSETVRKVYKRAGYLEQETYYMRRL